MGDLAVTNVTDVEGNVAHDIADAGSPVKIGGYASATAPAAVADADRVNAWYTPRGSATVMLVDGAGAVLPTGVQYIENAALTADLGQGTLVIARRDDALSTLTPVEGDAIGVRVNSRGALWVQADRSTDDFVAASATPTVGIAAALAPDRRYTSQALGTVVGNTQAWDCNGADAVLVHIGSTQTGTFLFEVSADGTNYVSAEVRDVGLDLWLSGTNIVPTANKVYRVVTNGWRSMRARTITTLNGTVAMTATLAAHSTVINAIDNGPAAHAFGYTPVWKRVTASTAQTGTAIWTPASGKRIVVTAILIGVGGTTAGTATIWFGASADTTYTAGTDQPVFEHEFAPSATLKPGVVIGNGAGLLGFGAVDEVLRFTTTNALTITIIVRGYEV